MTEHIAFARSVTADDVDVDAVVAFGTGLNCKIDVRDVEALCRCSEQYGFLIHIVIVTSSVRVS